MQDGGQDLVDGVPLFWTEPNHIHGVGDSLEVDFIAAQGLEGAGRSERRGDPRQKWGREKRDSLLCRVKGYALPLAVDPGGSKAKEDGAPDPTRLPVQINKKQLTRSTFLSCTAVQGTTSSLQMTVIWINRDLDQPLDHPALNQLD